MLKREQLTGPWAGLPVAWKRDGSFDEKTYRGDVARCCAAGVPGVYTGGTTGEFYGQEFEEFQRIAVATIEECHRAGKPAMIGCTALHTRGVIRRAEFARQHGADAIQVALPFWLAVPPRLVVPFFKDVARAVPGMAIQIYETTRAKRILTLEQYRQIHAEIPAVIGIKSNLNTLGCTPAGCRALSRWFQVFTNEKFWHRLGPCGVSGACSAYVYLNPRLTLQAFALLQQRRWTELKVWTDKFARISGEGLKPALAAGCEDTALDRLHGLAADFLRTSLHNRPPYPSATPRMLADYRRWFERNLPEFLEL